MPHNHDPVPKKRGGRSGLPLLVGGIVVTAAALVAACSNAPADLPEPDALTLRDVASDVGIDFDHGAFHWEESLDPVAMMGGGLCWLDYNADGWMDLYAVNTYAQNEHGRWIDAGGLPTNALYENRGGVFTDVSAKSGTDVSVRGNGCAAGDLDNDGDPDIYVTTERFNVL
ncbi:MAG: VCBS repeat-containing protein, partial [Actinomycetota bacterium]